MSVSTRLKQEPSWIAGVPDSEEERNRESTRQRVTFNRLWDRVIEISSDSDNDEDGPHTVVPGGQIKPSGPAPSCSPKDTATPGRRGKVMHSRVIESSDESGDEHEAPALEPVKVSQTSTRCKQATSPTGKLRAQLIASYPPTQSTFRLSEQDTATSDDDGAILVFDEPKSARKPIPKRPKTPTGITRNLAIPPHLKDDVVDAPATPSSTSKGTPRKRTPATPRASKKKLREQEQARLHAYAQELFTELNEKVFKNGLPEDTKLNWNKRLLTTAGRAKWHKARDGAQTSEIEMAEKILTSDERIRNTLSHEMCHLASWVIDKEIKEGHGKFWKAWTRKVMAKYPEIDISTRHDYEIDYPYKWKCANCAKIYGRFSKSIKPDECVCGACREGRLVPQFATRAPKPQTPRISRMAAVKSQDSPCRSPAISTKSTQADVICISSDSEGDLYDSKGASQGCGIGCNGAESDSEEDEVQVLAMTLGAASLTFD